MSGKLHLLKNATWLVLLINVQVITAEKQEHGFGKKSTEHIKKILQLDKEHSDAELEYMINRKILQDLSNIYTTAIKPLEEAYHFSGLNTHVLSEGDIFASPTVVLFGPWSVGKSSMVNYFLNRETDMHALEIGAQPTTTDFTIVQYGNTDKIVEGRVLAVDGAFSALEKFGQRFLERLQGVNIDSPLLKKVTFIDTPGIIENKKQQERGYPFIEVCKWFMNKADLIFVVFDPTKLDVGQELEKLFKQLKGHEAKIRIILNKADTVSSQELMRIYGALFWNFAPLINVTEPPRVYVGSFWSKEFNSQGNSKLFIEEERTLIKDMFESIANNIENKIAYVRQHAVLVRNHALTVDLFKQTFDNIRSVWISDDLTAEKLIKNSGGYKIFETLVSTKSISKHDIPDAELYKKFFRTYYIKTFKNLNSYCGFFTECPLTILQRAINKDLPSLLRSKEHCSGDGDYFGYSDKEKNEL